MLKGYLDELKTAIARVFLGSPEDETLRNLADRIDINTNKPLFPYASFPTPNEVLNISPSLVPMSDGAGRSKPSRNSTLPLFPATTINFQDGTVTGGTVKRDGSAFSLPTSTAGQFRRACFSLDRATNTLNSTFSAESPLVSGLPDPGTLFELLEGDDEFYIDLEATDTNAFKTAGSSTDVIENKVGSDIRLVRIDASGGGGGSNLEADPLQVPLLNNQATPVDVTGFFVDPLVDKDFTQDVVVVRHHNDGGDVEYVKTFTLRGFYKDSTGVWHIGESTYNGDDVGVVFSMTNAGQLQYTSTDIPGTIVDSYILFPHRNHATVKVFPAPERFSQSLAWNGSELSKVYTVSSSISDAREAFWELQDDSNNFKRVGVEFEKTETQVTVIRDGVPLPAGNYTLRGFR